MNDAGRCRRDLGEDSIGVGLEEDVAVARTDLELVDIALTDAGNEDLPNSRQSMPVHLVEATIPAIERPDDADPLGVRRPD